jgi:hypothetical protein
MCPAAVRPKELLDPVVEHVQPAPLHAFAMGASGKIDGTPPVHSTT